MFQYELWPSDIAALLLELCRIPSVIGEEQALADWIQNRAPSRWPCVRIGNNLVYGGKISERPLLTLFGHLDTVIPYYPNPVLNEGRVIGRGSSDMKAGLSVMLSLMAKRSPSEGQYDLAFVFYDREEGPYVDNGLERVLPQLPWLNETYLGFCLEPTDNRLELGCLGTLHAKVTFRGKAAHSARPWQGKNAIHAAGALLTALDAWAPREHNLEGLVYYEVLNATLARGGQARNVIPDTFELNLNYRFAPGRSLSSACDEVRALVGELGEVSFEDLCPSAPAYLDHPLVGRLIRDFGLEVASKQAWTDVARLAASGIPAVNLGPGEAHQAHQAVESTSVQQLEAGLALFERIIDA